MNQRPFHAARWFMAQFFILFLACSGFCLLFRLVLWLVEGIQ